MTRYTGGGITDHGDLLDNISTHCQSSGFTQEERYTEGDNSYDVLVLSYGGFYYYFAVDGTTRLRGNISASYTASAGWDSLNGVCPKDCYCLNRVPGSYTSYEMHIDSGTCYITLQNLSGEYYHFGFGVLTKYGTYTGGEFILNYSVITAGNNYTTSLTCGLDTTSEFGSGDGNSIVRANAIGANGKEFATFGSNSAANNDLGKGDSRLGANRYMNITNAMNNRAVMNPINAYVEDINDNWIPIGYLPKMRGIDISLISDGSQVPSLSAWRAFPVGKRGTSSTETVFSATAGYAFEE